MGLGLGAGRRLGLGAGRRLGLGLGLGAGRRFVLPPPPLRAPMASQRPPPISRRRLESRSLRLSSGSWTLAAFLGAAFLGAPSFLASGAAFSGAPSFLASGAAFSGAPSAGLDASFALASSWSSRMPL